MWRTISLRNRVNLIFASLFALWLLADAVHDGWRASGRAARGNAKRDAADQGFRRNHPGAFA